MLSYKKVPISRCWSWHTRAGERWAIVLHMITDTYVAKVKRFFKILELFITKLKLNFVWAATIVAVHKTSKALSKCFYGDGGNPFLVQGTSNCKFTFSTLILKFWMSRKSKVDTIGNDFTYYLWLILNVRCAKSHINIHKFTYNRCLEN